MGVLARTDRTDLPPGANLDWTIPQGFERCSEADNQTWTTLCREFSCPNRDRNCPIPTKRQWTSASASHVRAAWQTLRFREPLRFPAAHWAHGDLGTINRAASFRIFSTLQDTIRRFDRFVHNRKKDWPS